jgi:hypothetical protein
MFENPTEARYHPVQIRKLLRFATDRGYSRFADLNVSGDRFTTTGVLLGIRGTGKLFATLTDGRDQIQLGLTPEILGISAQEISNLQKGSRVSVTGVPCLSGRNEAIALPSLYVIEIHSSSSPGPIRFDEDGLQREAAPRLVIGHLMAVASEQLERNGYRRYEPRFITNSGVDFETEPLMVRFPGRGADLCLEVSPLPQLLYAAVMTGEMKLYSPARLFSRAFRDGFTSSDAPIVAAVELEMGGDSKMALEQIAKVLMAGFSTAQQRGLPFDSVQEDDDSGTHGLAHSPLSSLKLETVELPSPLTTSYAYDVRRRLEVETPSGQIIIDGHEGKIAKSISYNWLCIHVERLALGDFWRITERRGLDETGSRADDTRNHF